MKAAVLHQAGQPLQLEDVQLAEPREGEVLVRVHAAGICHSDLHYMTGDLSCRMPVVLGHEGAGIVEQVGPGVRGLAAGDSVVLMWRPRCGHCTSCATGRPALCSAVKVPVATGGLMDGTSRLTLADGRSAHHFLGVSCFAEYCVVAEESVIKIPATVPKRVAALVGCAVVTGAGAVLNVMGPEASSGPGVLIIGAGGVGLSAVMATAMVGAYPIVVADVSDERLALARSLGATHTVNSASDDLAAAVLDASPGGVQWAFEAVGKPETIMAGVRCLRPTGTLVAIGLAKSGQTVSLPINDLVQRDIRVVGSLYGSGNTVVQIPRLLELHGAGRLNLEKLIGTQYRLEDINQAYERLPAASVGRGIVLLQEEG
jgi:Zn-dependent alcohol dehydrogenase